jgi:hypothetical protein
MCAIGHPRPYILSRIYFVLGLFLETLNVNSRKAQWAYMRETIAMIA